MLNAVVATKSAIVPSALNEVVRPRHHELGMSQRTHAIDALKRFICR